MPYPRTIVAVLAMAFLASCAAGAGMTPDQVTTVAAGGAAALLAFAQGLLDAGAISEEQFAKLAASASQVSTTVDAVTAAMKAIAGTVGQLRGDLSAATKIAEAAWTTEDVLTASGASSLAVGAGVNYIRNRARAERGEPVGKQHVAPQ
jgi:phage shock protein A